MSAGCKQARQFENLWLQGVHLRPLMAMPVLEIDFVHRASFFRERCLQNNLEIMRSHKHRKMREKNTLFSDNQHVVTRGFFFVIVRVWVHFHVHKVPPLLTCLMNPEFHFPGHLERSCRFSWRFYLAADQQICEQKQAFCHCIGSAGPRGLLLHIRAPPMASPCFAQFSIHLNQFAPDESVMDLLNLLWATRRAVTNTTARQLPRDLVYCLLGQVLRKGSSPKY